MGAIQRSFRGKVHSEVAEIIVFKSLQIWCTGTGPWQST